MGSNQFGNIFRITTWGESHGKAMGVVIDGCPANLPITEEEINEELKRRRPGHSPFTSPRKEEDRVIILSGIYQNKTLGSPIALMIENCDVDSSSYKNPAETLRPGHADFTYRVKYGHVDPRGGGRSSGRETVARVAAGAIAKKLLHHYGIDLIAYIKEIGGLGVGSLSTCTSVVRESMRESAIFCPDAQVEKEMIAKLTAIKEEGDSLGGIVELLINPIFAGLGDPVFEKLQANLAKGLMSLPAVKGFEIGSGFEAARMRGSEHNDLFEMGESAIQTKTNHAGGVLGGISNGMPLIARVAFKPTSSIKKSQASVTLKGEPGEYMTPSHGRHDPCIAIRAVPVVESMGALVMADALLMRQLGVCSS